LPRRNRRRKNPDRYIGGQVVINKIDYTRRDYMSPGRLVAWAEWVPNERGGQGIVRTNS